MNKIYCTFFLSLYFIFSQEPISKQATLIETISSSEVMVESVGVYYGKGKKNRHKRKDIKKNGLANALDDARRSCIYFILLGGNDPLLASDEIILKYKSHKDFFFSSSNVSRYITYEDSKIIKKVTIDNGTGLKVTKRFKINKKYLLKDLEEKEILISNEKLSKKLGNPFILVLPSVKKGLSPIRALSADKYLKHSATVIESYLTSRNFDVVVSEQVEVIENLSNAQLSLGDQGEDLAYQLALSIGSDVYFQFSGKFEDDSYGTNKYSITIRVFETTTGRLLGSETGYSKSRKSEKMLNIEEAINDAIDKVITKVINYWNSDLKNGIQYKTIIQISSEFDNEEIEEIQFSLMDAMDNMVNESKENIITDETMDYIIWCDPIKYNKTSKVYRTLKSNFNKESSLGTLKKININRKILLLKIDND
tara:strand:+ start:222 stop:1490 length:1269 start_codon:yes stop_codon:yes gene_type:complete